MNRTLIRPLAAMLAAFLVSPATAFCQIQFDPEDGKRSEEEGRSLLQQPDDEEAELERLLADERAEADRLRRRGELRAARRILSQHLDDEPEDAASRALRALISFDRSDYERALADAERAFEDARDSHDSQGVDRAVLGTCVRAYARCLLELGRAPEAAAVFEGVESRLDVKDDAREAWLYGSALAAVGERERAERLFELGARVRSARGWDGLLASARCLRRLGRLKEASSVLVDADAEASRGHGPEPDILAELGAVYFEADREVKESEKRSAANLYKEALDLNPTHEAALLGMFELHRYNWLRRRHSSQEFLGRLFEARPSSIQGLVAATSTDLADGRLKSARRRLAKLRESAPGRRDVRTLEATLAWIENRQEDSEAVLAELIAVDATDATPEREVGRTLLELYRFAEGLPFLKRAVERDAQDHEAWTQLGRALANTGDEEGALAAFERAEEEAKLRQDAWRKNMMMVLRRMALEHDIEEFADLSFSWTPEAAEVLRTYLVPFYSDAREELAARYGHTPEPTRIEVFDRHMDFSVRSTGFQGFPALGVCFGPVVTAVSPVSAMRGSFSWARTSFHEFTHVIHLGLSHNRCPRWITEGLATWEEVEKNPAWTRNMRRDLLDARAGGRIIPVRDLNRAFRGPRILFGYYQGGLLCEMLIDRHGFPPMIRLLEAFDRGLDLDAAFLEVFNTTPEAVDRDFARFVDDKLAGLSIEPRWEPSYCARLRLSLERDPPEAAAAKRAWAEDWTTIAWGAWQSKRRVDAQEGLRNAYRTGLDIPRAAFLEGELAIAGRDADQAQEHWERGLTMGGEDYRVRMSLGRLAGQAGDIEAAERHFLAAEAAFPGFDQPQFSAERSLAEMYFDEGRFDDQKEVLVRWLAWNVDDLEVVRTIAAWHFDNGRFEEAAGMYNLGNQVDPFLRTLHYDWAEALFEAGRFEESLREFEMVTRVPPALDLESPTPMDPAEEAEALGWQARCLRELGRVEEAMERARKGLELDEDCEPCERAMEDVR
jgi:tetratricopeptide (TPR) repeat protein